MMDESNEPENALKVNVHSKINKNMDFYVGLWKYRRKTEKKTWISFI